MTKRYTLFTFLLLNILVFSNAYGQEKQLELFHNFTGLMSPEKVYLHTDKDVYFATDTIWFSGYVENASYYSEFDESNYIYVELISNQLYRNDVSWTNYSYYEPEVVERKKIKRIDDSFSGYIVVPEMNSTGRAIIRAYTYWMLNRPAEYMFYKELELTNPMKDKLIATMQNKKVRNKEDYLRLGEKMPSEKEDSEEEESRYDIQFLPESGNYIAGSTASVYIKCVGKDGRGAEVFGEVFDSKGNTLVEYKTDSLGFGKIEIAQLPQGKMFASVKDVNGYNDRKVSLQTPIESGVTIYGQCKIDSAYQYSNTDVFNFKISTSQELLGRGLTTIINNSSEIYFNRKINRTEESLSLMLKGLTQGIHSISVIDTLGNVYAQRAFLVLPEPQREKLQVKTNSSAYAKREKVLVKIKLPQSVARDNERFSVSVYDLENGGGKEETNIESYMLLKSELKGYIENLGWYFNDSIPLNKRTARADYLMQTQGWRYYEIDKILQGKSDTPYFGREYRQTLCGKVINPLRLSRNTTVSFVAQSIKFSAMGQVDSGYWVLKDIDFPENTKFIISAMGKNGKSTSHTPILQEDYFAPIYSYPVSKEKVSYSPEYQMAVESIYYTKDDGDYAMAFELNPVVVTSRLIVPKNSPSPIPNYPIRKDWYKDSLDMKPYTKNYTLGEYVAKTYPGVRFVADRFLTGPKVSSASGMQTRGRVGVVLIYLNGMQVGDDMYNVLHMPLSEIESVIYVSGLSAAPFQTATSALDHYPSPVLMVRTKPHVRTDLVPFNVSGGYPLGWQKPVKFYSPKYDVQDKKKDRIRDSRITLYWNPSVKLDENGEATISFYTSDSDSNYRIEVEGRSAARQYHYAEKIIERKPADDTSKN